jgi:hypothetical protein
MILKDKGIPDSTMMSLIAKVLKRDTTTKGFKVKGVDGIQAIAYSEVVQFAEELAHLMKKNDYKRVRTCETCRYFNSAPRNSRGVCFPENITSSRLKTDYCSGWKPMTPEQEQLRRKINELIQAKRVRDDSENSSESN